jgi:hypothetical protein
VSPTLRSWFVVKRASDGETARFFGSDRFEQIAAFLHKVRAAVCCRCATSSDHSSHARTTRVPSRTTHDPSSEDASPAHAGDATGLLVSSVMRASAVRRHLPASHGQEAGRRALPANCPCEGTGHDRTAMARMCARHRWSWSVAAGYPALARAQTGLITMYHSNRATSPQPTSLSG